MNIKLVQEFQYLGLTLNEQNSSEQILTAQSIMKSQIVVEKAKVKVHTSSIRLIVTYGCQSWSITAKSQHLLLKLIFTIERKILRRIFRPTQEQDR